MHGKVYSPIVLTKISSQLTPNSKRSGKSQDKKTVECGDHFNVVFITLHATTESIVHVQPLVCRKAAGPPGLLNIYY